MTRLKRAPEPELSPSFPPLPSLFYGIANAIRRKTGKTSNIAAKDFPTEIDSIKTASGDAQPSDVLSGKTFSNSSGESTGAMPNNSAKHIKSTNLSNFRFPHDTTEDGQHDESRYIAIGTSQSGYYTTDSSLIVNPYLFGTASSELVAKGYTFTGIDGLCATGTLPLLDYDLTDGVLDIWEVE